MGITVLQQLAGGGVFAILFGFMLWYVLNQNDKREIRYQNTIDKNQEVIGKLADKLDVIKDVQEDVEEAKKDIQYIKAKMG
jgi:hypothetical protein